ncbi:hypothetical protein NDU88_000067 [Pleurodeles waltl]|uniref:Uncharacterized protein n=1 Tax=Pleurodeles waltl TaxID=8319 RepID=A0AAV7N8K7_PLEWA|nr:hypothetical protein NDU88_000067 [Pleurodeles waltl]
MEGQRQWRKVYTPGQGWKDSASGERSTPQARDGRIAPVEKGLHPRVQGWKDSASGERSTPRARDGRAAPVEKRLHPRGQGWKDSASGERSIHRGQGWKDSASGERSTPQGQGGRTAPVEKGLHPRGQGWKDSASGERSTPRARDGRTGPVEKGLHPSVVVGLVGVGVGRVGVFGVVVRDGVAVGGVRVVRWGIVVERANIVVGHVGVGVGRSIGKRARRLKFTCSAHQVRRDPHGAPFLTLDRASLGRKLWFAAPRGGEEGGCFTGSSVSRGSDVGVSSEEEPVVEG